ncbi:tRNA glutamyl-Q(34) synthetase GluQRS [Oceanisphaera psychrotolerans]|uniref:Glutamyl-Q tRNA(Asp) synthetase n=1 Tax=Oceanisphaera psychrotolerans TaxID=1414654 RepID=A0A1J4QD99_9GAMM|nr:tRNA glutamyl-Q(34) synthetase GluQRS [Oceanisphaera psychrotolerans]OIN09620.1 tRNA glutamyl-Q(34) synthetase GluQRS [Oceanisphaera psychrotolerans]
MKKTAPDRYTGRFAPSPSGPLHFGSLIAALGSYLQARSNQGQWLLRIEDLDPPREVPGAADDILRTLDAFGLYWDGTPVYQSQRHDYYRAILDDWEKRGLTYHCHCTRKMISASGGFYNGHCRERALPARNAAVRLQMNQPVYGFHDRLQGTVSVPPALAEEDFIVRRRDGLYAYNLAVTVDDAEAGITEVVRGADLLEPTVRQIALYRLLGSPEPHWLHLPLAVYSGHKLSKQNHAPALDARQPGPALWQALHFLGQHPPPALFGAEPAELLSWACQCWRLEQVPPGPHIELNCADSSHFQRPALL